METDEAKKTGRPQIITRLREILEPWVSDADLLDDITERTNMIAELGLDSIGILQVVIGAEKTFGISISDRELDSDTFAMMGNFVSLVQKKIYENN
ncbi:MAG TPA: phosphopantetheine-binding protein [Sedimentisphaerales bacterium]|nr:phosphopantetheine-binding protein [Sedimentisphaerales bacterium]